MLELEKKIHHSVHLCYLHLKNIFCRVYLDLFAIMYFKEEMMVMILLSALSIAMAMTVEVLYEFLPTDQIKLTLLIRLSSLKSLT